MRGTSHRNYREADDAPVIDGDSGFRGVDERTNPAHLTPGWVAAATNCRFRNGVVEPRGGDVILPMMKTDGLTPFGECYGVATISDPAGEEWILVAADGALWRCKPHMPAEQILSLAGYLIDNDLDVIVDHNNVPIELGEGADGVVPFFQAVQCFNVVVLLRGENFRPLVMRLSDEGFVEVEQTNQGDGTDPMPGSNFGLFHGNRLWLQNNRDRAYASDPQDYTRYSPIDAINRINQGDNDKLIAMAAFGDSDASVLMLKDQSIWRLDNVVGDLSNATLRNITRKYGCLAPFSVVDFGKDIAWLSDRGLVTLGLTIQNESQGSSIALSDPMAKSMNRLRWDLAENVVAEFYDNKLYFALPFDEAAVISETDLVTSSPSYTLIGSKYYHVISGLEIGAQYQYVQGSTVDVELIEAEITGGNPETEAMNRYQGDVIFTAAATTVSLEGTGAVPVTATLKRVIKSGVNNAVMVYDTVTDAWAGVDERDGLNILRWFKVTYQGKLRLGYVSATGETRLYEEPGAEDENFETLANGYVDLVVLDQPKSGETLQIGGGTVLYPDPSRSDNYFSTFTYWGVQEAPDLDAVGANLWSDSDYGYATTNANTWSVGGHTVQQIDRGIRVTSATATAPALVTYDHEAAASQAITESKRCGRTPGDYPCFYVDIMEGDQVATTPIEMEVLTRGYHGTTPWIKKFQAARLQLETWAPNYTIKTVAAGQKEETAQITGETRNRTAYRNGDTIYDATNVNDDHASSGRQDYSVVLDDGQTGVDFGATGVDLELFQNHLHPFPVPDVEDWYVQLRFTNTQGAAKLVATQINSVPGNRSHEIKY